MNRQTSAYSAIQAFEREKGKPLFVVYGASSHFEALVNSFQEHVQQNEDLFYLSLTPGNKTYNTLGEVLFTLVQQFINALVDNIPEPENNAQLLSIFRTLWNVQDKVRELETEDQLAEFVRFTEFSCYPVLRQILEKRKQSLIIGLHDFEKIAHWGSSIHNFLLEHILQALEGINLHVVLFANSDDKPGLFYGSDEENARKRVFFYKL